MRKLLLAFSGLFCSFILLAQDNEYRSVSNAYYWKNRKPFEGYWQQDVQYTIKASLDDKTDIVDGEEELIYFNNSPDTLSFVYFHLYENAFVKGSYLEQLNLANDFRQQFGKYEAAGKGTEIGLVEVMHETAKFSIDNTIMRVELNRPLLPGSSVSFRIRFKTYFDDSGNQRRRMKLFKDAWGNKQYDGVHWYPRICVYDRKFGWETDQHLGKEFYGDFGMYDAELTLPNNYILDATGVLQNRNEVMPADLRAKLDIANFKDKPLESPPSELIKEDGSKKTWKFHAVNVHYFAWVADPTFRNGEK
jgi:aminopeptidase N